MFRRLFRLSLRRARDIADETDEEIRFHIAARVDRLMASGLSREAAEAEAWRMFGPGEKSAVVAAAQQREEALNMFERFDAIRGDAWYAIRQLRRSPLFTAAAVSSLAIGIGANAMMFGIIDRLLLRPRPGVVAPEAIMSIGEMTHWGREEYRRTGLSYPTYKDYRDLPSFERVAVSASPGDMGLGRGATATKIRGMLVSASYLPLTGVRPLLGRFILPDEDREPIGAPVVVVSYGYWQRELGGSASALGRVLEIGPRRYTIVGVTPKHFTGLQQAPVDVFIPITAAEGLRFGGPRWATSRGSYWLQVHARVKPGSSVAQAEAQGTAVARAMLRSGDDSLKRTSLLSIVPRAGAEATTTVTVSKLLAAVSVLVLLIACANVANLLVARAMQRRREIAVRLALGISRTRLVAQLMTESLVLAVLGGVAAIGVAHWGGQLVRSLLLTRYSWDGSPVDARLLAFTAVVTVAVGVVCGLLPAYQSGRADVSHALKHGAGDGGTTRSRARNFLLLTQAALAVVLLVGAGLFTQSLRNINAVELGMKTNDVVVGTMDLLGAGFKQPEIIAAFARMEQQVKALPGVQFAGIGAALPFNSAYAVHFKVPGHDSLPQVADGGPYVNAVTPEFFSALGIKIMRGRGFTDADRAAHTRVMVVSESMARLIWKNENPIGQCVRFDNDSLPCMEIIGVAGNTHRNGVIERSEILQYYVQLEHAPANMSSRILFVRPADGNAERWTDPVRRAMQVALPNLPYANVRPMRTLYSHEVRPWELGATMFGLFGGLALVLTGVGLYSVVAYATTQRRHEMGVRIALGAQSRDIVDLVVAQGVRVAVAGIVAGLLITLASGRFVATLLFGVTATDAPTMIGVGVTVLVVATVASLIPALRATRLDPVASLRTD